MSDQQEQGEDVMQTDENVIQTDENVMQTDENVVQTDENAIQTDAEIELTIQEHVPIADIVSSNIQHELFAVEHRFWIDQQAPVDNQDDTDIQDNTRNMLKDCPDYEAMLDPVIILNNVTLAMQAALITHRLNNVDYICTLLTTSGHTESIEKIIIRSLLWYLSADENICIRIFRYVYDIPDSTNMLNNFVRHNRYFILKYGCRDTHVFGYLYSLIRGNERIQLLIGFRGTVRLIETILRNPIADMAFTNAIITHIITTIETPAIRRAATNGIQIMLLTTLARYDPEQEYLELPPDDEDEACFVMQYIRVLKLEGFSQKCSCTNCIYQFVCCTMDYSSEDPTYSWIAYIRFILFIADAFVTRRDLYQQICDKLIENTNAIKQTMNNENMYNQLIKMINERFDRRSMLIVYSENYNPELPTTVNIDCIRGVY